MAYLVLIDGLPVLRSLVWLHSLRPSPVGIWKRVFGHLGLALLAQQNPKASGLTQPVAK